MAHPDGKIEEYKTLREEILGQRDRRSSRLSIVWAGMSVLLTVAALTKIPELGVIAVLLVCTGWMDENRWFRNIIRIGTYISTMLEPKIYAWIQVSSAT
ncbi:unnamed protein product [marine sediment metagenome]|uniref:Uncharacterized protein n=1 Tax=marine sediment metagenome TaxID=412755 RepID=X1EKS7_9ZZZZ